MGLALKQLAIVCSVSAVVRATSSIEAYVDPDHVSLLQTRAVHIRDAARNADLVEAQVPEPQFALSRLSDEDMVDLSAKHPRQAFREAQGIFKAGPHQGEHWQRGSAHRRNPHAARGSRAEDSWEAEVFKASEAVKIDDEAERFKLAARAGGVVGEDSEHAKVDALFREQVQAMTEAKETAVRHWAAAAEQEGSAAARSRSSARGAEGIAEDPMQQETELRRKLIVEDMTTSDKQKIAKRQKVSVPHAAPHVAPHRLHGHHDGDAKSRDAQTSNNTWVKKGSSEAQFEDKGLQAVADSLDRYFQPRRVRKANYDVLVGQHCGDCGTDLKIGTSGEMFDNVTASSATEVCGKVCDASQYCDGFSFSASLGRCYYRTSTVCDGMLDEDRDCYTKADRFDEGGGPARVGDAEEEHHSRNVSDTIASIISQTKILEGTLHEVLLKSQVRYTTALGHHCGDCGPENDLALVTGMVTNDSVAEICGQMCDSYAECTGFSFANSSGRCYFLRSTYCNGTADANRDCYTKVDHRSEAASSKDDGAVRTAQHLVAAPGGIPRSANVSANASANKERKPQAKIGNATMIGSHDMSAGNDESKPAAKIGNMTMLHAQNVSAKIGSATLSGSRLANGSAAVDKEIDKVVAGSNLAGNSTPVTHEASSGSSTTKSLKLSGNGFSNAGLSENATMTANNSHALASVKLAPGAYHIVSARQQSYIDATPAGGVSLSDTNVAAGDGVDGLLWRLDAVPGNQDVFFIASAHKEQFLNSNGGVVSLWKPAHARDAAKGGPESLKWRLQVSPDSDGSFLLVSAVSGGHLGANGSKIVFSRGDATADPGSLRWQLERAKTRETEECDKYIAAGDPACAWTGNWSCPAQSLGSRGVAGGNGGHDSIGFRCCCHFGLWAVPSGQPLDDMARNGTAAHA